MRIDWTRSERFDITVKSALFGANMLFDRDRVDETGTYDDVLTDLGVTGVRYPGGSISEWYFDINNPDNTRIFDPNRGDAGEWRDLTPLTEFLTWAGTVNRGVSLVLPTRNLLADGAAGTRQPLDSAFDDVKTFVRDVLDGKYGDARIDAIEVGNEYWHGGGMDHVEYGRIADVIARASQEAIDDYRANTDLPRGWTEPEIVVQVGQYGEYSHTGMDPEPELMDSLSDEAAAAIDAVVVHYYSRGDFNNLDEFGYYFDRMDEWAEDPRYAGIAYHVTEWHVDNWLTEEYGMRQASTMVWMMSDMIERGVDAAHVWPVQQETDNDLAGNEGHGVLTIAGETMRMMAERLPGLTLERRLTFTEGVAFLFADGAETVVLIASRSATSQTFTLDTADLGLSGQNHWSVILGTDSAYDDPDATPTLEIRADGGSAPRSLDFGLGAYEVVQVTFTSDDLRTVLPEVLRGGGYDDTIAGSDHGDQIEGRGDADDIEAGDGADLVDAGAGDDTVDAGRGPDLVLLGDGDDRFEDDDQGGPNGADKVFGGTGDDLLQGRGGDDALSGDDGNDTIKGGDGKDTLFGLSGDDRILGDDGNDEIEGGSGSDRLEGGADDDSILGGSGEDTLKGESGDDVLRGGTGADRVEGGSGDDALAGDAQNDQIYGDAGNDTLAGGDGDDTLEGGAGADVFVFDRDDGTDRIQDFTEADLIDLRGQGLTFSKLRIEIDPDGDRALVSFAGTTLDFRNLDADLGASDFLFV